MCKYIGGKRKISDWGGETATIRRGDKIKIIKKTITTYCIVEHIKSRIRFHCPLSFTTQNNYEQVISKNYNV